MLEKGIVEKSSSLWLNPVRLHRKKDGKIRFCVDMRRVNDDVILDEYRVPRIEELVRSLKDQSIFSKIDLKDGYFQVNLKKEDRMKTAFLDAENRLLHYTKMPQGYINSPAIFQRGMNMILEGLVGLTCFVYLDDILIFGKDKCEHDKDLKEV